MPVDIPPGIPSTAEGTEDTPTAVDSFDPVAYLKKHLPQAQYYRMSFDRNWFRNILFFAGIQWLKYSRASLQWRPISLPNWFPKQVTNKFAVACNIMKSVFMQSDPQSIYSPATGSPEDISSARAAEDIERYIEREVGQSALESIAANWTTFTGNAFIIDGYDNSPRHGTRFVQDSMCLFCAKHIPAEEAEENCPSCGNPVLGALDGDGQPIGKEVPIGALVSEIASPFEIHLDMTSQTIDNSPYVIRSATYPVEVLQDMFPDFKDKIKAESTGVNSGMFYQTSLAYLVNGVMGSPGSTYGSIGSVDNIPRATLYTMWIRPTRQNPKGIMALIVSDNCVWKGDLPYHDEKGNPVIPISQIQFDRMPGRVFARTPADDLVWKQVQLNKIEAFIQLGIEKTCNPVWLVPLGAGSKPITGEPGQEVKYNSIAGLKPERMQGSEIPGSVYRWLQQLNGDIQDISHTYDVLRGMTPKGIPTLGGAQLVLERGYAGFADALKSWGAAWNQSRKNRLDIWREYCIDERTLMVLGEDRQWEAKNLSNANMKGRVNVYLDEGSLAPKSKAYQQLVTAQLLQTGLLNVQDPMVRVKIMTTFDAGNLVEDLDIDIKDACKEKDEFLQTNQVRPRPGIDNDAIHASEHIKVAKSDSFKSWPPALQAAWTQHIMYHNNQIAQQQKQAQMNDPRFMAAEMKKQEIQAELQAFMEEKKIELQSLAGKKQIELGAHRSKKLVDVKAHGVVKGMEAALRPATHNGTH